MGMTLGEKIIARAAGVDFVKPNDIHTVTLDRMMSNDGTTHLTVDMYHNKLKNPKIADKDKVVFIMDHNVPAENPKTAEAHKKMRDFAIENDIKLYEGQGVCHQIMMEDYVCPGELIFGADSHTTSYGALGAFGTGVGCTDFLYAMTTGTSWVMVPETIRFNLHGKLREGVYPRDLILTIIGDIGANGASYKIMEFAGDGAHNLSVDDRMVLCNLTVEAGAKAGIVEPDEKVVEYCKAHGREAVHMFKSDEDAHFCDVYDYALKMDIFDGLTVILKKIRAMGKPVVVNGGDIYVTAYQSRYGSAADIMTGVNQESVWSRIDFTTKTFHTQKKTEREYFCQYLQACKADGMDVYLLEYTTDHKLIRRIKKYCRKRKYDYYIADSLELGI